MCYACFTDLVFKLGLIAILVAFFYLAPPYSLPTLRIDPQQSFSVVASTVFGLFTLVIPALTILTLTLVASIGSIFE